MTTYQLNIRELIGLSHLAPTKDPRYYLIGVHVTDSNGILRLQATNGHCLGEFSHLVELTTESESIDIIIPLEVIKQFKVHRLDPDYCTLTIDGEQYSITLENGITYPFTPIDGTFPDCQRLLNDNENEKEPSAFDLELLAKYTKLGKALNLKHPGMFVIEHRGNNPAPITHESLANFRGMVMPFKL